VVGGKAVDERAVVQGHEIRFATVDLGASAVEIRTRLLGLIAGTPKGENA
jgi:5-methylcytosine-specific restriction enzyme subunit McrC